MCCSSGKVDLQLFSEPPPLIKELLDGITNNSKEFLKNVRLYNAAFQMTSFGASVIRESGFMPTFKVEGQISHRIGSLLPLENQPAKYMQIYFIDDYLVQAQNRLNVFPELKHEIIIQIQNLLFLTNSYIKSFKYALEMNPNVNFKIVIDADKRPNNEHSRRFNAPECNEVAVIMTDQEHGKRDIIIRSKDNALQRINETHRSYDALQYPLICLYGEDGYHFGINHVNSNKSVSCKDFYSYMFMLRDNSYNMLHRYKGLFQQYVVDMYAKIESERLAYIKTHQKELRADSYIHLKDSIGNDGQNTEVGKLCILPSSYTGSPRYMHEKTQDAMTYVRCFGRPDLFVTFTCNPLWPEITKELFNSQLPKDRHDLIARVFQIKVKKLISLINKFEIFGPVQCYMYTVEWQKRGLPHAHILIWLKNRLHTNDIDKLISAELPDPRVDKELFEIVKSHMIHGPCGAFNNKSPCMKHGKCSKKFPKKFVDVTLTDNDGYPMYKRRNAEKGGIEDIIKISENNIVIIDNRWVVPYNPLLLKTFNCHINVEFCNSVKSIKYVCKYINKGSDAATYILNQGRVIDEVSQYQLGRYISSNEAFWRIFGFDIHCRYPPIQHLSVHLENGQRVYFTEKTLQNVIETPKPTTLTGFFKLCQHDLFAKTLLYHNIPSYYIWNNNKWNKRKRGITVNNWPDIKFDNTLGRIYSVHPNQHECFYLRILLNEVRGPTSFENLRTVGNTICSTYKEACIKRGLLEDDSHWNNTLLDASVLNSPIQIRQLFAILLNTCEITSPYNLWLEYKDYMTEDYRHQFQQNTNQNNVEFNDNMYNIALINIENILIKLGGEKLINYGFPIINTVHTDRIPSEVQIELAYDQNELNNYVTNNIHLMNNEQKYVFNTIIDSINTPCSSNKVFFLDAPGGTGKTFVIKLLLAQLRKDSKIVIAVASSGIASTLLPGGKTAHSAFKLPLKLTDDGTVTCNICKGSGLAELIKNCSLIIWDECTMSNRILLEALDRTFQDILENNELFGGIIILFSGDFRQTLPVVQRGTRGDQVKFCLKSSYIWSHVKLLKLSVNMRVLINNDNESGEFCKNLLEIGDGKSILDNDNNISLNHVATIVNDLNDLINNVFPDLQINFQNNNWLCERGILASKNQIVDSINNQIIKRLPGEEITYKSCDSTVDIMESVNYPTEFLNSLEISGVPSHKITLKLESPIMLLRNLDASRLCNCTCLIITKLMANLIEAMILTGCGKGENVFIPRIPIIPSDSIFNFRRLQFPIKLCFAMSINKSQGQTFKVVGINLHKPCFSHGQLYVALSRVSSKNNLYILAPSGKTKNVVYQEALK